MIRRSTDTSKRHWRPSFRCSQLKLTRRTTNSSSKSACLRDYKVSWYTRSRMLTTISKRKVTVLKPEKNSKKLLKTTSCTLKPSLVRCSKAQSLFKVIFNTLIVLENSVRVFLCTLVMCKGIRINLCKEPTITEVPDPKLQVTMKRVGSSITELRLSSHLRGKSTTNWQSWVLRNMISWRPFTTSCDHYLVSFLLRLLKRVLLTTFKKFE